MTIKPVRTPNASGGMAGHSDKWLKLARQLAAKQHEPTSQELKLARHLAQDGATWAELHQALGWTCALTTTQGRLRRFNIFARRSQNAKGRLTKYGVRDNPDVPVSGLPYRPKDVSGKDR